MRMSAPNNTKDKGIAMHTRIVITTPNSRNLDLKKSPGGPNDCSAELGRDDGGASWAGEMISEFSREDADGNDVAKTAGSDGGLGGISLGSVNGSMSSRLDTCGSGPERGADEFD